MNANSFNVSFQDAPEVKAKLGAYKPGEKVKFEVECMVDSCDDTGLCCTVEEVTPMPAEAPDMESEGAEGDTGEMAPANPMTTPERPGYDSSGGMPKAPAVVIMMGNGKS